MGSFNIFQWGYYVTLSSLVEPWGTYGNIKLLSYLHIVWYKSTTSFLTQVSKLVVGTINSLRHVVKIILLADYVSNFYNKNGKQSKLKCAVYQIYGGFFWHHYYWIVYRDANVTYYSDDHIKLFSK